MVFDSPEPRGASVPLAEFAVFEGGRGVRSVADIAEGHCSPRLDLGAPWKIGELDIVVADFDRVDTLGNRSCRSSHCRRAGSLAPSARTPKPRRHWRFQRSGASGRDRNVLVAVYLVDHWSDW